MVKSQNHLVALQYASRYSEIYVLYFQTFPKRQRDNISVIYNDNTIIHIQPAMCSHASSSWNSSNTWIWKWKQFSGSCIFVANSEVESKNGNCEWKLSGFCKPINKPWLKNINECNSVFKTRKIHIGKASSFLGQTQFTHFLGEFVGYVFV